MLTEREYRYKTERNGCSVKVNHANPMASDLNHSRLRSTLVALLAKNYGLYALFLKQGDGCSIRYGREKYDYQEGTVVSFKQLLIETRLPVSEIAYQLGFEYPQHFSRLFKQVTKKTPLQYKEDFTREFSS